MDAVPYPAHAIVEQRVDPIIMPNASTPTPARLSELRFLYQPIEPLADADGWAEALVRWYLPDGTVRGPLDLLPYWLAEPRIATFTRYTLSCAAGALAAAPHASVSVNLSPLQVLHPRTLASLEAMLPALRERLRLEITEQSVSDLRALGSALTELRARCRSLLLDDVTPDDIDLRSRACDHLDGVKLDRSVIVGSFAPDTAGAMRRFIRDACDRFETVVAEGIEDAERCDDLRELGVTHVQGFGIGRPRAELDGVVRDRRVPFASPPDAPTPSLQRRHDHTHRDDGVEAQALDRRGARPRSS